MDPMQDDAKQEYELRGWDEHCAAMSAEYDLNSESAAATGMTIWYRDGNTQLEGWTTLRSELSLE